MNKNLVIAIVITFVLIGIAVVVGNTNKKDAEIAQVATEEVIGESTVFYAEYDPSVTFEIIFAEELAKFVGSDLDGIILTQVESASGAKYENKEANVAVWNKGSQVTIYKNDIEIFTGIEGEAPPVVEPETSTTTAEVDERLTASNWVWSKTEINDGRVLEPSTPGAFILSFAKDGTVRLKTDCNSFSGMYTATLTSVKISSLGGTEMACAETNETDLTRSLIDPMEFFFTEAGDLVLQIPYDSGSIIFTKEGGVVDAESV